MKRLLSLWLVLSALIMSTLSANAATATLFVGQSYQKEISASGYHYLSVESVSSTNPSVSVTKMGLVVKATVNAYFSGEADITIRLRYQLYGGQIYQYRTESFTIACNDTRISLSPANISLKVGEKKPLGYSFNRSTYVSPSITWSSSDNSIIEVSSGGVAYAKKEGNATVYAHSNLGSNTASCNISVSQTGGSSGGSSIGDGDKSWYDSSLDEFHIKKGEEFVALMSMVAEGNSFSGKTIYLDDDIDLSSINWTNPIGFDDKKPFSGTFDGQNHNINYKITYTTEKWAFNFYYGLFGFVDGNLLNFSTSGIVEIISSAENTYIYIGGIVGKTTGNVNNCYNNVSLEYKCTNTSKLSTVSVYLGGIAGYSSNGKIENCINEGDVIDRTNRAGNPEYNNHYLGGICGSSVDARIRYCFNTGKIECGPNGTYNSQDNITAYIGGIAGFLKECSDCGNIGSVLGTANVVLLGGIAGMIPDYAFVSNCYVASNQIGDPLYKSSSSSHIGLFGGLTGSQHFNHPYNYVAFDIQKYNLRNGLSVNESYSTADMKTKNFVNVLNSEDHGNAHYIGGEGLFPLPSPSVFMPQYNQTVISNITCTSALLESNARDIIGDKISSCGFLVRLDDGKEYFKQCDRGKYQFELTDLIPNRTYFVRWFAKDIDNKEYYGYDANFKTKPINPKTLEATAGVFSAKLRCEYYISDISKAGFFIQELSEESNGHYYWSDSMTESDYEIDVDGLKGNTEYSYRAIIESDGIYYEGNEEAFKTKTISTLNPSEATNEDILLNGEIGIDVFSAWFEFRAESWPSMIESEKLYVENAGIGKVSVHSPKLQLYETYNYRLAVENTNGIIYSDWIDFLFKGQSNIENIEEFFDNHDLSSEIVSVYASNGILIFRGYYKDFAPAKGLYIIKCKDKSLKIKL